MCGFNKWLFTKWVICATCLICLQACKHPLAIVGEGDIVDANNSGRGCTFEQFQAQEPACTENKVTGGYVVNYKAEPRPGWRFVRWEGPCSSESEFQYCRLNVSKEGVAWWDATYPDTQITPSTAVFEPISDDRGLSGCAETSSCTSNPPLLVGADRPAEVSIPSNYTPTTRYPLIIVLHGYTSDGAIHSAYLGLGDRVDGKQYVLIAPDGTANANGDRFWNATPASSAKRASIQDGTGEDYSQIDDVAYIRSLIELAAATYSIDTTRIGLIGHSNGGYMALRMACEASDYVTSVVSFAGSTFEDPSSCHPATHPVSILSVHGDLDDRVLYDGGVKHGEPYPGAEETIERFASLSGCDVNNPGARGEVDVVGSIAGSETTVLKYPDCADGTNVELWTIVGGPHIPFPWVETALDSFVDWLIAQPRN